MKRKPLIFNLYSSVFLIGILFFPLQIQFLYGHSFLSEFEMIISKLTIINWAVMCTFLLNSILCYKSHPLLKIMLPLSIFMVATNNWIVANFGQDFSFGLTLMATAFFSLFISILYFTEALDVILDPSLRWWKVSTRYSREMPIWIKLPGEKFYLEKTHDISESGIFISKENEKIGFNPDDCYTKNISLGDLVSISIPFKDGKKDFQCKAQVVRKSHKNGHYPGGVGLKFIDLKLLESFNLKKIIFTNQLSF